MRSAFLANLCCLLTVLQLTPVRSLAQLQADPEQQASAAGPTSPHVSNDAQAGIESVSRDSFDPRVLQEVKIEHEAIEKAYGEAEETKDKIASVKIFNRGNERTLDFESHHSEMLERLSAVAELVSVYQELNDRVTANIKRLLPMKIPDQDAVAAKEARVLLDVSGPELQTKISKSLNSLMSYRQSLGNQLLEDVHRYQLKNAFRTNLGIFGLIMLVAICGALLFLIYQGTIQTDDYSTLQLFAMVMIIFVVALFGMADVMSENGITGILAAIAGYILGKASNNPK